LSNVFDGIASDYERAMERSCSISGETPRFYAEQRMRWCARRLAAVRVDTVLDFGCGVGGSFRYFLEILKCTRLIGVDTSRESLREARTRHSDISVELSTPSDRPPGGDVDLAFCNGVFHHISPAERPEALDYIRRSMKDGGVFAFWENNPWNPVVRYSMSITEFDRDAQTISPAAASRMLKRAGFRIRGVDFRFFFPRFASGLRGLEAGLSWCPLGAQYLVLAEKHGVADR
jgi:SAM-dependent methyltransferase